jgi:hypothetical protein
LTEVFVTLMFSANVTLAAAAGGGAEKVGRGSGAGKFVRFNAGGDIESRNAPPGEAAVAGRTTPPRPRGASTAAAAAPAPSTTDVTRCGVV